GCWSSSGSRGRPPSARGTARCRRSPWWRWPRRGKAPWRSRADKVRALMKTRWKLLGLAGVAGFAATGAVVARQKRETEEYTPEELRDKLRSRVAESETPVAGDPSSS